MFIVESLTEIMEIFELVCASLVYNKNDFIHSDLSEGYLEGLTCGTFVIERFI